MDDATTAGIDAVLDRHDRDPGRLLDILREAQDVCGWISPPALDRIGPALGLSHARVRAVAGFYAFLRLRPGARYEILFGDCIVDQLQGKDTLMRRLCEGLWVEPGKRSEDGLVFVDSTSCTGMCDQGPALLINGLAVPALTDARIDSIVAAIQERRSLELWPAALFEVRDNVRKAGPLLAEGQVAGEAVRAALARTPEDLIAAIERAGLRGRGGAGYPTAAKWASCRRAPGHAHHVVCNADEGEPGTFKDRVLLASAADLVFDGMTLCGYAIGAASGQLYLRGEYLHLVPHLEAVLARRRAAGLLGPAVLGTGFGFDIRIVLGAGAYVCGEESALIESLEGKPGKPRNRPPYPDTVGYRGQPTAVNNVETLACAALIARDGAEIFAGLGTPASTGTKLLSVAGDCARPGVYEYPFGVRLADVLRDCGARSPKAVQVSGPSGTLVAWQEFERRICFEDLPTAGALTVFERERDILTVVRNYAHFFAHESCGFCTPCRVGTTLMRDGIDKLHAGRGTAYDMAQIRRIAHVLGTMSHCGLGHTAANPVVQAMEKFPDTFERRLRRLSFEPAFDLDAALQTARLITGRDDRWAHIDEETP